MGDNGGLTRRILLCGAGVGAPLGLWSWDAAVAAPTPVKRRKPAPLARQPGAKPRNIVFILTDDHRYDALGFLKPQTFLETPNLDRLAAEGVHFKNGMVTTALCSPSRASIFTGLYAHQHRVVDNNHAIDPALTFFPEHLQRAGYETAFIGKWHMGPEGDDPQPGFDHWVSFKGQGTYLPSPSGLNVDGRRVPQAGYITDELTDYALRWLERRKGDKPFMLFLSHKAVHSDFIPADRHRGRYAGAPFRYPATMAPATPDQVRPRWVQDQRNSWHGVDYPYHSRIDIADYYRRYAETLLAVDESAGRLMDHLQTRGVLESTLILYLGDNGFAFGEHGLIDKRTAYEESIRIPMLARCPELFGDAPRVVDQVVANIDMAPTLLSAAGLVPPKGLSGRDAIPLAQGKAVPWRDALLYEYYWERNFPQTPTVHAVRGDRYKYIRYHGVWDADELYDLTVDPLEARNLIFSPGHEAVARQLNTRLFDMLAETGGTNMPLARDAGFRGWRRRRDGPPQGVFPDMLLDPR
jgi:N-acetylglucosamine-6-sulfatase